MKTPLFLGFLVLWALLGATLVLSNRTIAGRLADERKIIELQAVRLYGEALLRTYVDAETGQRGFLITGDEAFLEPYRAALTRVAAVQAQLGTAVRGEPELNALQAQIDVLGAEKLAELEARIDDAHAGRRDEAVAQVKAGVGRRLMEQMRQRVAEMDRIESAAIQNVIERSQASQRWAGVLTTGSSAVVSAALVGLFFFTRRTLRSLDEAREASNRLLAGERAAHSEAAQANRMKDEFLALISHELRTPLNAMLGWTSLLKEGFDSEAELHEGLEIIDRNARAQARLVEDLLDVSRIISGKVRLEIAQVDLRAVTSSVVEALRPAAEARGVKVSLHSTSQRAEVLGDSDRLQQVVWNLLSNAIKFTPRSGSVTITLENADSKVLLSVADTGPGIDPDFLPRIFDRFSQGDRSSTRGHGGLGLGLAITRHLVELHGGKIAVESEGLGRGATFRIEIPVVAVKELKQQLSQRLGSAVVQSATSGAATEVRLDGKRILAVDDQADTLMVINRVLSRAGAEVRTARSAADGLSILSSWSPGLIISDVGMPGQDGYTFIREVRTRFPGERHRAVALTAFAREADRKAALDAGFDDHLAKPVDAGALLRKAAELLIPS